jgi:hypothetical protein
VENIMTPQERQLIDDLFERLARVENTPRDREATEAIADGLRRAPNAVYALVQTVLVQDEALKRADAHIQELEAGAQREPEHGGSFLGTMRDSLFGRDEPRGSVPHVRPSEPGRAAWNTGQVLPQGRGPGGYDQPNYPQGGFGQGGFGQGAPGSGGGSFLGTAAAAAAGVVGGSLLLSSIRGMMGGGAGHQSFGDTSAGGGESRNPWSSDSSGGNLARDAGVNDIGSSQRADSSADRGDDHSRTGLFDQASNDQDDMDMDDDFDDGGDSDYA